MTLKGAIGKKRGMTTFFAEDGTAVTVTVIELMPLTVSQLKSKAKDGYNAVQVAYEPAKAKHLTKGQQGHLTKKNLPLLRRIKEFRVDDVAGFNVGDTLVPEFLASEGNVKITGRSIGKGFAGRIKLHNFHRGPMSHGSKSHRLPGSIGAGTTPGRVFKGQKMAAHMGDKTRTIANAKVMRFDAQQNLLVVSGPVPGKIGATVTIAPRTVVGNKATKK